MNVFVWYDTSIVLRNMIKMLENGLLLHFVYFDCNILTQPCHLLYNIIILICMFKHVYHGKLKIRH